MNKRAVIYPLVYSVVALVACAVTWSSHAPPTADEVDTAKKPPATRTERKREMMRSFSAERQAALSRHLEKGTDWRDLVAKKTFGEEMTEAFRRAMADGDHAAALVIVMQGDKRGEGLRAVFRSWALADPAAALDALVKLEDPPPHKYTVQLAAAQGYFHGLNAGPPGTLEAHVPETLRKIPNGQVAQAFFDLTCEHLLITGRADGARLLDWWKSSRQDMNLGDGVTSLAKAVVIALELEKKAEIQQGERLAIHAGVFRAIESLPEGDRSTSGVSDWLIHMTGGMEDRHTSLDAYETPKNPVSVEIYMKGAAQKFAPDPPAEILSLMATAKDDTDRAKADGLWSGYVSHRARQRSTLDLMMEFSSSDIPPHRQQSAARSIVNSRMNEDSILLTTLVNDLPENALKDAYRLHIADWLQQNRHKEDAEMWRNSIRDKTLPGK
ncbi:MAG: hypothetical protein KF712_17360 [Akkermansiaceae bacterium]|nr:hypothetical protein [Akkermansiaceae bacterium]